MLDSVETSLPRCPAAPLSGDYHPHRRRDPDQRGPSHPQRPDRLCYHLDRVEVAIHLLPRQQGLVQNPDRVIRVPGDGRWEGHAVKIARSWELGVAKGAWGNGRSSFMEAPMN